MAVVSLVEPPPRTARQIARELGVHREKSAPVLTALKIDLRPYLMAVLPKLDDWPAPRVAGLPPTAWKAAPKP